jgi:hypothetical protein
VLRRGVSAKPLLLSLASAVNQLAGGMALVLSLPQAHMALGGVAQPLVLDQLRGNAASPIDYDRLAQSLAKVNIYTKTQKTQASLDRLKYTQALGSS